MNRLLRHRNHQIPPFRRDRTRVIPLEIIRRPVMQVHALPVRIVTGEKSPTVDVEFVTERETVRGSVKARPCVDFVRRVLVDQPEITNNSGDLSRGIDPSQIIRAQRLWQRILVRRYDRVPGEKHDQRETQDEDTANVHESTDGEDAPAVVVFPIPFRVRVVQVVVGLCVGWGDVGAP